MSFTDKVAVITGAGSGIGAATAARLSAKGVRLVLVDVVEDNVEALRSNLNAPDRAISVVGDVANPDTADRVAADALDAFGGVDLLFNNAGVADLVPAEDMTRDAWRRVIDINLNGAFYVAQTVGRIMIERRCGAIVNTASMAGVAGMPDHAAYVASKHAIVGLTKALAVEWAQFGIRVNALCPGLTDTEIVRRATVQAPDVMLARAQRTLFGRLSTADEQAAMVEFLLSDDASYVSGLVANVDGGGLAMYSG